ncbi:unnamed protein product [Trichobilharzia regenti]|nr:unnamed protein product [Trichobilharzia regenti]
MIDTSHPTKLIDISHINSMMKSSPCSRNDILDKCEWGTCLNLGGDLYKCDCLSNYQYSQTEGCIPKTQTGNDNNLGIYKFILSLPFLMSNIIDHLIDRMVQ